MNNSAPEIAPSAPAANITPRIASLRDIRALEETPYEAAVPVTNMYDLFRRSAELWGDRSAITWLHDGTPDAETTDTTYAELFRDITRAANMFRDLGVDEDSAVAFLLPNMPEAHIALWGAETAGRACPINNLLNPEHIVHLIHAAKAKVLVALGPDPELGIHERAMEVRKECPDLAAVLIVDGDADPANGINDFREMLASYPGDALTFDRPLDRSSAAACFHTGGTTGAPKLAQHTHGNQVHTSWSASLMYDLGPEDVLINGFPLFHVAGCFVYGTAGFIAGARLVLPTRAGFRNPDVIAHHWSHVDRFRISCLAGVPTILAALMNTDIGERDISSVKLVLTGGTPLPTELAQAFEDRFDLPIRNVFGMTECAGLVSVTPLHGERRPNGCGFPLPYSEVRAVPLTDTGPDLSTTLPPNEPGVMVLRGPHVSPGYTEAARNAGMFTDDGWLISGDLGHIDERGEVFLTGRSKDVIIRGAHNIDPAMIEEAVDQHPAVEMSAAIGQPDGYAGELPVAYVTLKQGAEATPADILAFANPLIAERPAQLKAVHIIDAMPVTAIGKIYKPTLRLRSIEQIYGAALADLEAEEGVTVRIEGVDRGGSLSAIVRITGGDDCKAVEAAIAQRLRDFAVPWECVWA